MTKLTLTGVLLGAADDRMLRYKLLPYGADEIGLTNKGRVTASKGVLTLPEPSDFHVNLEHDRRRPAAVGAAFEDEQDALYCTVRALATTAGNDLLVEAREGVRAGISVEIDAPVIRGGRLLGGALSAAGAVVEPAWETARLVASKEDAPDEGEQTEEIPPVPTEGDEDQADDAEKPTADSENEDEESTVDKDETVAKAPGLVATRTRKDKPEPLTASKAADLMVTMRTTGDPKAAMALASGGQLFGALDLITDAEGADSGVPAWIGEVWSGNPYQRRIIPLLQQATLTSLKIHGWRWVTPPEVDVYAGPPAEIYSAPVEIEPVESDATRWAGGNRLDRRYYDFNDREILQGYLSKLAESYARKTDAAAAQALVDQATAVTPGTVGTGVSAGLAAIVDGALAFISKANPAFSIVSPDVWRDMLLGRSDDALIFLGATLGLDEGELKGFRVIPFSGLPAKTVITAAREAATHYELPGSPIRVNAQAVAVGSVDEAVFGYDDVIVNDPTAVSKVTLA